MSIKNAAGHLAEIVERDAWMDLFAASPPSAVSALGMRRATIAGVGLIACPGIPITELNRAMAVGQEEDISHETIAEVIDWLTEYADESWAMQVAPNVVEMGWGEKLVASGLAPRGAGWAKFVKSLSVIAPEPEPRHLERQPGLAVELARDADRETFGRLVQGGFGLPEDSAELFAHLAGRPGWRCYIASFDGEPVGSGALFQNGVAAWMGMDTTAASASGKGVQTALIAARVKDATTAGAEVVTAETARSENPTGQGLASYRNYRRAGFDEYARTNFAPVKANQ